MVKSEAHAQERRYGFTVLERKMKNRAIGFLRKRIGSGMQKKELNLCGKMCNCEKKSRLLQIN
jgi:hypothetical protein